MQLTLSQFFAYLVSKKAFYGRLASSLERIPRRGLGTLAVGIRDGRAVLLYDPTFLVDLSLSAGMFALEHEMLHLVLDHIPRYLELLSVQPDEAHRKKAAAVYNIAMDCSINTMLRNHEGFNDIDDVREIAEDIANSYGHSLNETAA
jgi:predicted metal-dependent peptidase